MLHKFAFALILPVLISFQAKALLISGGLGFGGTTMTNETSLTEGPFTQTYTVEYLRHSYLALGVEHLRSLSSNLNSSASFTGLLGRYYFNAAPSARVTADETSVEAPTMRDIALFVGVGAGLGQSSNLPGPTGLSSNTAGVYISPRGGFDYQIGQHFGLRAEVIYALQLFGSGSMSMMSLGGSAYWIF